MRFNEANFDGLVGPTHNYAGLSVGNVASTHHAKHVSNPRLAAKQGLQKMKALADRGFVQGVLPPQRRPALEVLHAVGFRGTDAQLIEKAAQAAPQLLAMCYSASCMWTANAATVSPSPDTADGRLHFTPANLATKFHRSLEPLATYQVLKAVFQSEQHFHVHHPLPGNMYFGDEGAANHTRFCSSYGQSGIEFFVFGRYAGDATRPIPTRFPARQTWEASSSIARLHGLDDKKVVFAQQNPDVIDAGVFHNDVIAVGNQNILFCHEKAFWDQPHTIAHLKQAAHAVEMDVHVIEVPEQSVHVEEAVRSYLFNSQLLSRPEGGMLLVVPQECKDDERVWGYLQNLLKENGPIREVLVFDLRESMQNGGGPACLRLRVVLSEEQLASVNKGCLLNDSLFVRLNSFIDTHYRDRLEERDLADPMFLLEALRVYEGLLEILNLRLS